MKRKVVSAFICMTMITGMLAGCGEASDSNNAKNNAGSDAKEETAKEDGESTSGGYSGELEIMHYSTEEESQGNGGSDGMRTVLSQWDEANPDIELVQTVLANADYKTQIQTLADADDLPDVFLLQGMNTKSWAEQGLILDLTDYIKDSPYQADYNEAYFTPFKDDEGKIYGYPVLTGGTCTVVVYDSKAWADAGYDKFPETWEEVEAAIPKLEEAGYQEAIAFGNGGQWQANSDFLSTLGDRYTGKEWFQSLIDKGGAAFTDAEFVAALKETQHLFHETEIFNKDFNAITNEDAREYYIGGSAPAFIGGNWDVSYIQASVEGTDLYDNTKFAVLPQPKDAKYDADSQNIGLGYAVAINPKLVDDPDKLEAAIDLAQYITGPEFASFVAENYALGGLTKVDNVDLSKFDQFTQDFYNYSYVDTTPCEIYDSYISSEVWNSVNVDLQTMMNGDMTPEEVAENAQKVYESNY